jgi:hypothetical protein
VAQLSIVALEMLFKIVEVFPVKESINASCQGGKLTSYGLKLEIYDFPSIFQLKITGSNPLLIREWGLVLLFHRCRL